MKKTVIQDPTPPLRSRSKEIDPQLIKTPSVQKLITDLKDTLAVSEDGIGIAAPQIAEGKRIFIISEEAKFISQQNREKKQWKNLVYINPVFVKKSREREDGVEGCLSVPGKFGIVSRHQKVSVEGYDESGRKIKHGATKFFARVLQHEMDHLDGILFIDKVKKFVEVEGGHDERL